VRLLLPRKRGGPGAMPGCPSKHAAVRTKSYFLFARFYPKLLNARG
jgi:hypothetical protein